MAINVPLEKVLESEEFKSSECKIPIDIGKLRHSGEMLYSSIWLGGEPIKVKVPLVK